MKYYKTRVWSFDMSIDEIEIERETSESVWIDGHRFAKKNSYEIFFKTKQECKDFHITRIESQIASLKRQIEKHQNDLETAKDILV